MIQNIPLELRALPQWCAARTDAVPVDPNTGHLAKVDDPSTWGTYDQAVATGLPHIGFVFSATDPYTVIDLDDKEYAPATEADKQAFANIIKYFQTYTEQSRSGRGWHLICRGNIGMGRRRGHVEVYSQGRFMILTGNGSGAIEDRSDLLRQLVAEMPVDTRAEDLEDTSEEEYSDATIMEMAMAASNAEKFNALCNGEISQYPSQSEADLALLSIIAFYTSNNAQVRRIFRSSPLGKREKAQKNDRYLNFAIGLIRGKEPPPIDLSEIIKPTQELPQVPTQSPKTKAAKSPVPYEPLPHPPGFLGELTRYFESAAIRPVHEISMAAAIGVLAGVIGRAYNISGTGLNQYLLLLAPTGTGKEGIQMAVDRLIQTVKLTVPSVDDFIGPAAFASGQALIRTLADRPGFVSVIGEFGLFLQQLSDARGSSSTVMLKKVLLDIYGKSGASSTLRSSVYSDSDKNTKIVQAPSLTILGESTPSTFFDGISPTHVAEGLIPRFLVINYTGPRPPANPNPHRPVPPEILERMVTLATMAITCKNEFRHIPVETSQPALVHLEALNIEADNQINARLDSVESALWNRAHLKALKLAGLLAAVDNPYQPTITEEHALWAIAIVRKDIQTMTTKFFTGDIGHGDSKQINDLRRVFDSYFKTEEEKLVTSYAIPAGLRDQGVVPYVYLSRRIQALASFRSDDRGSTFALKRAIEELTAAGEIQELPKTSPLVGKYSGRAFVVKRVATGA